MDKLTIGSYNPPDSVLGCSPMMSPSSMVRDGKFSDESSVNLIRRSSSGKFTASSLPSCGFDLMPQANKDRGVVINGRFRLYLYIKVFCFVYWCLLDAYLIVIPKLNI